MVYPVPETVVAKEAGMEREAEVFAKQDVDDYLDAEDYILFYGREPDAQYAKYSSDNVYWLTTSGGTGEPMRMTSIDGTPDMAPVGITHSFTVHHEEDQWYLTKAPGDDSVDRWVSLPFVLGEEMEGGRCPCGLHPAYHWLRR